jgi:hypothetical protein
MHRYKIIGMLKSFTDEEIFRFRDFLSSPYYNKNKKLLTLYNELLKYYPEFSSESLNKNNLFRSIYRDEDYNDSTFRNLAAQLLNLGQKFLLAELCSTDKLNSSIHLMSALFNRNQNELFRINSKKIASLLDNPKKIDFNYLYNKYQFERNLFNFNIATDKIIQEKKIYPPIEKLNNSGIYLTIYFLTEIICQYINFHVYSEKYNTKQTHDFLNLILNSLDIDVIYDQIKGKNDCDFILKIYIMLYKTFSEPEAETNFRQYKELVIKHAESLSDDEISFHYYKLISYCILKINSKEGKYDFDIELFDLYQVLLEKKYYKNQKFSYLPPALYRDILLFALKLKKFDWVRDFIRDYSNEVHPDEVQNMFSYGQAFYYYETKDYNSSLNFINKISVDYFIYKYDIKNLLLKIFYELGYTEEALSMTHSYKEFLRNNKFLSEKRKRRHKNFVKYLERLILIKSGSYTEDVGYLRHEIKNKNDITYKNWFLEKLDEFQIL